MKDYPILIKSDKSKFSMTEIQESYLYSYLMNKAKSYTYTEFKMEDLDISKLNKAWNKLINIHPILRSKVNIQSNVIEVVDIYDYEIHSKKINSKYNERDIEFIRKTYEDYDFYCQGFPLFAINISEFEDSYIIHFLIDSMIIDGKSASLLLHQWYELYTNDSKVINSPNILFNDYVYSIQKFKESSLRYKNDINYWIKKLSYKKIEYILNKKSNLSKRVTYTNNINKEQLIKKLNYIKISPSIFFLEVLSQLIFSINNNKESALIITLANRFRIDDEVESIIGPFTSTIIHSINSRENIDFVEMLRKCKREIFEEIDHNYCNSVEVLRNLKNQNIQIPIVYTYRKEIYDTSFSNYISYTNMHTSGVYLECVITEYREYFSVEWFTVDNIFNQDMSSIFVRFITVISEFIEKNKFSQQLLGIEETKSLELSNLQKFYLSERFQGNYSGVIFKQLFLSNIKVSNLLSSFYKIMSEYTLYTVDIESGCFNADDNRLYIEIIEKEDSSHKLLCKKREETIKYIEQNIGQKGIQAILFKSKDSLIIQLALDMVHFTAARAAQLINEIYEAGEKAKTGKNDLTNYSEPLKLENNFEYYTCFLEFSLLSELNSICDYYAISIKTAIKILIYSVLKKWGYLNENLIINVEYSENYDKSKPCDTSRVYSIQINETRCSLIELAKKYEKAEIVQNTGKYNEIVFTDCLNWEIVEGIEERDYSYASTPNVGIDCVMYKINGAFSLEFNVDRKFIEKEEFLLILRDIKFVLKEFALERERWNEMFEETNLLHKNLLNNFINNNKNNLSFKEYKKVVYDWNDTQCPFNESMLIQDYFYEMVDRYPDHPAIITRSGSMTYRELDEKSNILANNLLEYINEEELVGVYMRRDEYMIITLLGIIKSGKAYLPFNTTDPHERIKNIISDSKIKTVIVDSITDDKNFLNNVKVYNCRENLMNNSERIYKPNCNISSDALAYVIFTSGSTGRPKGVAVNHKSVINLIEWCKDKFEFNHNDKVACVNPINFDLSVFDIFGMLSVGASIRMVNDEDRKNPYVISDILMNEGITFWDSAPAYLNMLLPVLELNKGTNSSLRLFFLSGDWIPLDMPERVKNIFMKSKFVSLGGATEATVWSNYYILDSMDDGWKSIPYGRPMQNSMYYILDENLQPCKVGDKGSLYIAGECLSIGYYKNNELTRDRFVENPYSERYKIMYKTGDLARHYSDGNIEFLGREDNQVKVRGYRIELGEIEAVIKKEGFSNCIALVNDEEIIACIEFGDSLRDVKDENILNTFKNNLPEYMVPKKIYTLPDFPSTENGKIDRKKIEEMINKAEEHKIKYSVNLDNRDNCNVEINDIILEIMNIDKLESYNLGDLGFNSLQYTILSVKIKEKYNVEINPVAFYKMPDISDINNYLKEKLKLSNNDYNQNLDNEEENFNDKLMRIFAKISNVNYSDITLNTNLRDLNINSLQVAILSTEIFKEFGIKVNPTFFYKFEDVQQVLNYLIDNTNAISNENVQKEIIPVNDNDNKISIIGMEYKFPCYKDNTFIETILKGYNCSQDIPKDRWDIEKLEINHNNGENCTDVKKGNFIENIRNFDSRFFKLSPREAELMDPRQRLLLEGVWRLLEKSGYSPSSLRGRKIGVFIGATGDEYYNLCRQENISISELSLIGTSRTVLANRINYFFDWHGPSEVIDTACSSSLVALHRAELALKYNECELAIVGGINIIIDSLPHISLDKVGMLSKDGQCKTFDCSADGYGRGEGYGLILLKSYEKASKDNDNILATIMSSTINHGGKANALTAPNPNAQSELIYDTLVKANIDANEVRYLECHGTGTQLGDPIEIEGIKEGYKKYFSEKHLDWDKPLYLGSVKSNIGHLEAAAGIASLIKMIICMQEKRIPTIANLSQINSKIELEDSKVVIPTTNVVWEEKQKYGGISSFGFGGVNAHVILGIEKDEKNTQNDLTGNQYLVPISAPSEKQLNKYLKNILIYLKVTNRTMSEISHTLMRRTAFKYRQCLISDSISMLTKQINAILKKEKVENFYNGNTDEDKAKINNIREIDHSKLELEKLAQLWCWGAFDTFSYHKDKVVIANFPVVPFNHKEYWFMKKNNITEYELQKGKINESNDISKVLGTITIDDKSKILKDHIVGNLMVVPGALYLEYLVSLSGMKQVRITDFTWLKVLNQNDLPKKLEVRILNNTMIFRDNDMEISFGKYERIREQRDSNSTALKNSFNRNHNEIYDYFTRIGIKYGNLFRKLDKAYITNTYAYALLNDYVLDMGHLDAMFQLVVLMSNNQDSIFLPFNFEEMKVYDEIRKGKFIIAEKNNVNNSSIEKYNLKLFDEFGKTIVEINNYTGRKFKKKLINELIIEEYSEIDMQSSLSNEKQIILLEADTESDFLKLKENQLVSLMRDKRFSEYNLALIFKEKQNPELVLKTIFNVSKQAIQTECKLNIVIFKSNNLSLSNNYIAAIESFGKSVKKEYGDISIKVVSSDIINDRLIELIFDTVKNSNSCEFKYNDKEKRLLAKSYIKYSGKYESLVIEKGLPYIITGGSGKIGNIIAKKILEFGGIPVILSRSQINSNLECYQVDITDKDRLTSVFGQILSKHKKIGGIFNLAGKTADRMLYFKEFDQFTSVIDTKIQGTINILECIKLCNIKVAFLVNFSSLVSIIGNIGQSDYAMANRFLDKLCLLDTDRIDLIRSINWPYWLNGGMQVSDEIINKMRKETKQIPMNDLEALDVLFNKVPKIKGNEIILTGENDKFRNLLN